MKHALGFALPALALLVASEGLAAPMLKIGADIIDSEPADAAVERAKSRFEASGRTLNDEQRKRVKTRVAKDLLSDELLKRRLASEKLKVTKKQMGAARAQVRAQFRHEKGFRAFLAATGQTPEDLDRTLELRLKREALVKKILKRKAPTLKEAEKALEKDPTQFNLPPSAKLKQILIIKPRVGGVVVDDEATLAALRQKARKLTREVSINPKGFSAAARRHSQGPAASTGGDLGTVRMGRMGDKFDRVVFRADRGTVVGPIETDTAFHIVYVEAQYGPEPIRFTKPVPMAFHQLYAQYDQATRGPLLARLFIDAKVEVLDPDVELSPAEMARTTGALIGEKRAHRPHKHGPGHDPVPPRKPDPKRPPKKAAAPQK